MYWTTSDGKEVHIPDGCSCCSINTVGEHEWNCPLFAEKSLPIALETWPPYEVPKTYEELCEELRDPNGNHLWIGRYHKVF